MSGIVNPEFDEPKHRREQIARDQASPDQVMQEEFSEKISDAIEEVKEIVKKTRRGRKDSIKKDQPKPESN